VTLPPDHPYGEPLPVEFPYFLITSGPSGKGSRWEILGNVIDDEICVGIRDSIEGPAGPGGPCFFVPQKRLTGYYVHLPPPPMEGSFLFLFGPVARSVDEVRLVAGGETRMLELINVRGVKNRFFAEQLPAGLNVSLQAVDSAGTLLEEQRFKMEPGQGPAA